MHSGIKISNFVIMYNEKLEQLIDCALADGVITDMERKVLIRNAVKEGIDEDEFAMVLDARLHKMRQQGVGNVAPPLPGGAQVATATITPATRKNQKQGEVMKCPSCGSVTDGISHKCKSCGYEFRHVEAVSSARELFETILNTHSKEDKIRLISTYPVPNTKEDLMELLTMSVSNSYIGGNSLSDEESAWLKKTGQIYQKILIVCSSDNTSIVTATQLLATLIGQLPNKYKGFTNIPVNLRQYVVEAERLAKEEKSKRKKEAYRTVLLKTMPGLRFSILAFLSFLFLLIGISAEEGGPFIMLAIFAFIGLCFSYKSFSARLV